MVVMITFASNKCFGLVDIDHRRMERKVVVEARSYVVSVGSPLDCLTLEKWTHMLSQNVSIKLPIYTALHLRRAKTFSAGVQGIQTAVYVAQCTPVHLQD